MHPADLETLVDRELHQLPLPRAPHTLLPRVLAAVHEWAQRPWYARAWLTWPRGWQAASIAALVALVAAVTLLLPIAMDRAAGAASTSISPFTTEVAAVAGHVAQAATAAQVVWRALVQPFVPYAFVLVMLMCAACAACAVALNHAAFGRTLQS
jgi:hypothetical protein